MKLVIAGASGFLGNALIQALTEHEHHVTTLVRREPTAPTEAQWRPERGELDPALLAGSDAVISLSGAGIGDKRWTAAYKKLLVDSRVAPTETIARALASLGAAERPTRWLSASAVGFYGERGDEVLTESARPGSGFLADLVVQWEDATAAATAAGVRVSTLRTGLVLSHDGGLLKRLVPLFKVGLGGKLGSGKQFQSWITLADEIGAIEYLLGAESPSGPINLTAPTPVRNDEFSHALGKLVKRPSLFPTPAFGLRAVLGEFADEGVLVSQRVVPEALLTSGYGFQHSELEAGLGWALKH